MAKTTDLVIECKPNNLYFKVLSLKRVAPYRRTFSWPPIGTWTQPIKGRLAACRNGYHLARPRDLFRWLDWDGDRLKSQIYLAEAASGPKVTAHSKIVVKKARLLKIIRVEPSNL